MKSQIEIYVGQKVREYREKKGWSQQYLGDVLNLSRTFIANRENPNEIDAFNLDHIDAIADILGCTIWNLLPQHPINTKKVS